MIRSPWLNSKNNRIVRLILNSHEQAFNYPLLKKQSDMQNSKNLFSQQLVILAHDNSKDPILVYANALALKLWEKTWEEMIGMPSRLTAPEEEQKQREIAIKNALNKISITNYEGIRITSTGKLFLIKKAKIWKIWDEQSQTFGQAASFLNWEWMSSESKG